MCNSVWGYIFSIHKLWSHQTFFGFHVTLEPYQIAIKAPETLLVCGEHACKRMEYTYRGVSTIRDGYLQRQIFDLNHQV